MGQGSKNFTYLYKSPSFSPRRFNVTIPASWYFSKKVQDDESVDILNTLFHELSHFQHLLGTTYGIYYYITTFTQLISSFLYLKGDIQEGHKRKLPIKKGVLPVMKEQYEGFLDYMEQSISVALFEEIKLSIIVDDRMDLSAQKRILYEMQHETGETILLPTMFYKLKLNTGKELNIPIGARAIMENYAKHLEYTTGIANPKQIEEEHRKHYYYFFLTGYFLRLKNIPDNIKNDLLSCLYYLSLMSITPLITNPDDKYFGIFFKEKTLSPVETVKLLKHPGLIFYDALRATIEIAENSTKGLDDLGSFLNQLCDKIQLPNVDELNKQLGKFVELCLDKIRKTSYFSIFPFMEYYLELSLKFINIITRYFIIISVYYTQFNNIYRILY